MPRYHFDLRLGADLLPDPEGHTLPDADAAWERARRLALDLLQSDLGAPVNWPGALVVVRDAAGETVLEFPFAEALGSEPPH